MWVSPSFEYFHPAFRTAFRPPIGYLLANKLFPYAVYPNDLLPLSLSLVGAHLGSRLEDLLPRINFLPTLIVGLYFNRTALNCSIIPAAS